MLAFVREGFDTRIHSVEDIRDVTGVAGVCLVPAFAAQLSAPAVGRSRQLLLGSSSPDIFVSHRPHSPEAEALLGLFTSVRLAGTHRMPQVILVASSLTGEGKTTIATNLAVALSRQGSTCIVDADLRKPSVAKMFRVTPQQGLADVLRGGCPLRDAFIAAPQVPALTLLPGGSSATERPGELLCSPEMADLIRDLRRDFQFVLLDTAPVLPFADARSISSLCDGVVFVGRCGVTTRQALMRSLELLAQARSAPLIDFVFNDVDFRSWEYRDTYGEAYTAYK